MELNLGFSNMQVVALLEANTVQAGISNILSPGHGLELFGNPATDER